MPPRTRYHPTKVPARCYMCQGKPGKRSPLERYVLCEYAYVCTKCNADTDYAFQCYLDRMYKQRVWNNEAREYAPSFKMKVFKPWIEEDLKDRFATLELQRKIYLWDLEVEATKKRSTSVGGALPVQEKLPDPVEFFKPHKVPRAVRKALREAQEDEMKQS